MLTLTICFVFVYRYGKFRGRGTGPSRIPRRRSRNTSASHSLFPSTTGYLVQRRTQNPSQQSDVSLWICWVSFSYSAFIVSLSFSFSKQSDCTWLFLRDLCYYTSSPEIHTLCFIASRCVSECVCELVEVIVCYHISIYWLASMSALKTPDKFWEVR